MFLSILLQALISIKGCDVKGCALPLPSAADISHKLQGEHVHIDSAMATMLDILHMELQPSFANEAGNKQ